MDERIEKILKTDADARKRINRAQQHAKEVLNEADAEIEKIRIQYEKKAEVKLKEIKKELQKKLSVLESEKKEKNEKLAKALEETAKEKTEKWVERIYNRVISK